MTCEHLPWRDELTEILRYLAHRCGDAPAGSRSETPCAGPDDWGVTCERTGDHRGADRHDRCVS